jgi:protein involved in polysaccharide export with SLBB domain
VTSDEAVLAGVRVGITEVEGWIRMTLLLRKRGGGLMLHERHHTLWHCLLGMAVVLAAPCSIAQTAAAPSDLRNLEVLTSPTGLNPPATSSASSNSTPTSQSPAMGGDLDMPVSTVKSVDGAVDAGEEKAVSGPQHKAPVSSIGETEARARQAALQNQQIKAEDPQQRITAMPYPDIPALQALYTQVPSASGTLRRFGSEAFLLGAGNTDELPADLPVGPDYILGPGDQLVLNLWGSRSEHVNVAVDRQGQIALPEAGTVIVNGLTITKAQDAVQRALNSAFRDEHVEISMGRLRSVRVYVVGDVQRPGAYDVSSLSTALGVLYTAGGPTARGSLRILSVMREGRLVAKVDLYDFLIRGVRGAVERLQPGDTIVVPPVGPLVTVNGAVHHPAIYELNGESTLGQVLELAGGVLTTADLKQIEVTRVETNTRRTMLNLTLPAAPAEAQGVLAGFHIQGNDEVVLSQILPYNEAAVYLAGHVFRPGQYAYRDGITVADLIRSYRDVMPEPADRGQVVRLVAPDFHPVTIPFQLPDLLMGSTPILLQPFDTVEVFGRYDSDAPRVRIEGQVLHAGTYPMSAGMTVSALLNMAGGFDRSALRDVAGLTSYTLVDGKTVEIGHREIDLLSALARDTKADLALKPGDVLSIRQMTGWSDIGSSVTITGEIAHPGGYGFVPGERMSSVVRRAGGFLAEAYPAAAFFTRKQVQALAEQTRLDTIARLETTPIIVSAGTMSVSDQQQLQTSLQAQRQQAITALRAHPASGRLVVNLTEDVSKWENTAADIYLRAGDTIYIPKRPTFVLVNGQVYNSVAISLVPGHDVKWYLNKGGGATHSGDTKHTYLLRADGSVVVSDGFGRGITHAKVRPGDAVIVPEKIVGGGQVWRDVLAVSQSIISLALVAAVAGAF